MHKRAVKVEPADLERAVGIAAKVVEAVRFERYYREPNAVTIRVAADNPAAPALTVCSFWGRSTEDYTEDYDVILSREAAARYLKMLGDASDAHSMGCSLRLPDANLLIAFAGFNKTGQNLVCCVYVGIAMNWILPKDAQKVIDHWGYGELYAELQELVNSIVL